MSSFPPLLLSTDDYRTFKKKKASTLSGAFYKPSLFSQWTATLFRGTLNGYVSNPWELTAFGSYTELGTKHTKIKEQAPILKE